MSIKVLLVDDHHLVRAGLRSLIDTFPDINVVGEASDGQEAITLAIELKPEIVVMDVSMPKFSGLESTKKLKKMLPETKVIILSMHASNDFVEQALDAGASGYMLKDAATEELSLAIKTVFGGGTWISPAVSSQVINQYLGDSQSAESNPLTSRQTEILRLIAEGLATKQIAHQLSISSKTVESHRAQIMERLGIRDVAGLVRYAIRMGLVKDD